MAISSKHFGEDDFTTRYAILPGQSSKPTKRLLRRDDVGICVFPTKYQVDEKNTQSFRSWKMESRTHRDLISLFCHLFDVWTNFLLFRLSCKPFKNTGAIAKPTSMECESCEISPGVEKVDVHAEGEAKNFLEESFRPQSPFLTKPPKKLNSIWNSTGTFHGLAIRKSSKYLKK